MLHAFTKEVLNLLHNKHVGAMKKSTCYERPDPITGVLVNFTDGISDPKKWDLRWNNRNEYEEWRAI